MSDPRVVAAVPAINTWAIMDWQDDEGRAALRVFAWKVYDDPDTDAEPLVGLHDGGTAVASHEDAFVMMVDAPTAEVALERANKQQPPEEEVD